METKERRRSRREYLRIRALCEAENAERYYKDMTPEQRERWEVAREALLEFLKDETLPGMVRAGLQLEIRSIDKPHRWLLCAKTGVRLSTASPFDIERQEAAGPGVPFRHRRRWFLVSD